MIKVIGKSVETTGPNKKVTRTRQKLLEIN